MIIKEDIGYNLGRYIIIFIMVAICIIIISAMIKGYSECEGTYVRGLFWFECIENEVK